MDINEYSYALPEERIAKFPLEERDASKLLIYHEGRITSDTFGNLSNYLSPDDFLILNNTRVIPARLGFKKETGAAIEILCLTPVQPADYTQAFAQTRSCTWECIVGNLKKWKQSPLFRSFTYKDKKILLEARISGEKASNPVITFTWDNDCISFAELLDHTGKTPIPPYLKRDSMELDRNRYQTVYSYFDGSVAAPTAGLHFTAKSFEKLSTSGINYDYITLHVGSGTFQPVKELNAFDHTMHSEPFVLTFPTLENIIQHMDHIVAVGTTSLRTLESIYWLGVKMMHAGSDTSAYIDQWIWKNEKNVPVQLALETVHNYMIKERIISLFIDTSLMIVPGYKFAIPHALVTNFHMPKSTLLLLIAAFTGDDWKNVYRYALDNDYRFLSYGDSSLLFRR